MKIDYSLNIEGLRKKLEQFWHFSGKKILDIDNNYDQNKGSPVYTVKGKYTTRGWTEWTQGFEFGSSLLQFDITGDKEFLKIGRKGTIDKMAYHVGHYGVHDHGFNNVSTYGNLLRLMKEGKVEYNEWEQNFYMLALKLSGSVQARRWTNINDGGYIYSFNGPHSLFVDTIRTIRSLTVAYELGFYINDENDRKISLLERAIDHAYATARYSVYYGEGRDDYDECGRTAHESIFNINDGNYRCPNSQQGFSGFTTWMRGLAWAMTGFSEQLEYVETLENVVFEKWGGKDSVKNVFLNAAKAVCDFYIDNTPVDGIPYWDSGAPGLNKMGNYLEQISDPYNDYEPIDSSAAAIGAQGLLRLGRFLKNNGDKDGDRYWQAGLTVMGNLLDEPYLSVSDNHQGLILHSVYHRPNGWDYIPEGFSIPNGESSMWGDYHAREAALLLYKMLNNEPYYTFFASVK